MTVPCRRPQSPDAARRRALRFACLGLGAFAGLHALRVLLVSGALAETPAMLDCGLQPGPTRSVARVVDGDTVRLDDGKEVRLAGVLAPKAFDTGAEPGRWPPETAARDALQGLAGGGTVHLAFDGDRADRCGRSVAHLFLERDGGQLWVQGWLAEQGHVRILPVAGQDHCLAPLMTREATARNSGRGLWANAAYQVRPADRPGELERYRGTFQLVLGRVEAVGGSRNLVIVDLVSSERDESAAPGRGRGRSTRVTWARSLGTGRGAGMPRLSAGQDVLVRGWVEGRGGPQIEVRSPAQVDPMQMQNARR